MAKRITDTQRLIAFAMAADEATLAAAIELLTTLKASRYPKKAASQRKPRADKGKARAGKPNGDSEHVSSDVV